MKLCLVMLARIEKKNNDYFLDKKNINVINRYLKYFDEVCVVARKTKKSNSLYPREVFRHEKVTFSLYEELEKIYNFPNYIRKFKAILKKNIYNSDLILCWAEPKTNIIINEAKKLNKTNMIYVGVCTRDALRAKRNLAKKFAGWIFYFTIRNAVKKADYVHYVTDKELQRRYPTSSKQIGSSYVNVNTQVSEKYKAEKVQGYKKEKKHIQLGLIGYLNEIKGIDTAIFALSKLDSCYRLKVLGGGEKEYYKTLAKQCGVQNRIEFEGTLPPGEPIFEWLDKIDIYIQPSRTEGLPRATIEAMSRGCPIVTSTAMGLIELTDEKWRHKPGDWKTLAYLIQKLAQNKTELSKQSARSFNVVKKYDRDVLDNKIDIFFKEILNNIS